MTLRATTSPNPFLSVKSYGAIGNGVADDTAAIQAAINAAVANQTACLGIFFPDGTYKISSSLGANLPAIVGLKLFGESRGGTIITMVTNNTPIFHFTAQFMHSCHFDEMTLVYATMQTGNTSAAVFQFDSVSGGSIYNCVFSGITSNNFYWFANAPDTNFWGNTYRDMSLGDLAGGVNNVISAAGEPNCRFERMYISCASATQTLFNHNAVTAQFDNIEVNSANSGATMLYDGAGGNYVIGHWALEVATYNTGAILFNVPNGQIIADFIYTETMTIGNNATVIAFLCGGSRSSLDIRQYEFQNITVTSGNFLVAACNGPLTSHFHDIRIPFASNVSLTDVGGSVACQYLSVDWWNDRSRMQMNVDANVTVAFNDPYNQVFDAPLTANRTVTLPDCRALFTNNLFAGRAFRFTKTNTSAFSLTIKDSIGNTIETIAASTKGIVEVAYNRSAAVGSYWVVMDNRTFT